MQRQLGTSLAASLLALTAGTLASAVAPPTDGDSPADRFVGAVAARLDVRLGDCHAATVIAPGRMVCGTLESGQVDSVAHDEAMRFSTRGVDVLHVEPMLDRPELYKARHPGLERPPEIPGFRQLVFLLRDQRVVIRTSTAESEARPIVFTVEPLGAPFPLDFLAVASDE